MQEMAADERVVLFGEDIAGGAGRDDEHPEAADAWGGPFGVTKGLFGRFGRERVIDTAIAETGFIGASIGAAYAGLRPVAEIMYIDFIGTSFDQVFNQAAKMRYVSAAILISSAAVGFRAVEHSGVMPAVQYIPGLKVVALHGIRAKGLLIEAIRDPDPVIFIEHKRLYMRQGPVPEEPYTIPFGVAQVVREGSDVTIVGIQKMVHTAVEAADGLTREGVSAEVIDPRTLSPLDLETIIRSVRKTGFLVVVDESNPRCSLATDIAGLVASEAFEALRGPVGIVTAPHMPVPFSPPLEDAYIPSPEQVAAAVRRARAGAVARVSG
jgi:pyruvate dehydrogenase E1 component beta subunit